MRFFSVAATGATLALVLMAPATSHAQAARNAAGAQAISPLPVPLMPEKTLPRFTVVSVKPSRPLMRPIHEPDGGYWSAQMPFWRLITFAFNLDPDRILGLPEWTHTSGYAIEARLPPGTSSAQFHLMLQALLVDRFQFAAHEETRPMAVSVLTSAARPGPGLKPASPSCVPQASPNGGPPTPAGAIGIISLPATRQSEFKGCAMSMAAFAGNLSQMRSPVVDQTGLKGLYDLEFTVTTLAPIEGESTEDQLLDGDRAMKSALQKQLGLNLDFAKTVKLPFPVLVIDHVAPASAN